MNTVWLEVPHDWVAGFQGTRPGRGQQSRGLTVFFNLVLRSPAGALLPGSVTELIMNKSWLLHGQSSLQTSCEQSMHFPLGFEQEDDLKEGKPHMKRGPTDFCL